MLNSLSSAPAGAKKTKSRAFTLFVIVIAVLSAIVLWLYVLGYDSPNYEKEFNVAVTAEGESELRAEKGYTVVSDFGFNIKVTVSGPQSEVNMLRADDIKAYIDVSGVTQAGNNSLPIYVVLPNENKLAVASKSVESAVVFIDRCIAAEIPVRVQITDYTLSADLTLGDYTINPTTVTVEGPESVLANIEYAYASIVPGEISGSVKSNASVSLRSSSNAVINNSYIVLLDPSVEVSVPVYKTKDVPMRVHFVGGYYSTESATITLSSDYIKVKGLAEDVDRLDEIRIDVAENTLVPDPEHKINIVKKIVFPGGIQSADGVTDVTATIVFNDMVHRKLSLYTDLCVFTGKPDSISVVPADPVINVTVFGPPAALALLTFEDFALEADLSYIDLKPGQEYSVPVEIGFAAWNDIFAGIYVAGDYDIKIITSAADE